MSKQIKHNGSTVRRVLKLIRPYAGLVALTLTLAAVTVFTTLLAPVLSGKAVDLIVGPGQVDFAGLAKLAVAIAATILCTAVAQWLMNVVNNRITFQVVRDMRIRAFRADGDPAAEIYGRPPPRRCHQPDHHRRGTVQ